jgi:hypothetical protein
VPTSWESSGNSLHIAQLSLAAQALHRHFQPRKSPFKPRLTPFGA